MTRSHQARLFFFCMALLLFTCPVLSFAETAGTNPQVKESTGINIEEVQPAQVDSVLAKLSDEQVRSLLIAKLEKDRETAEKEATPHAGVYSLAVKWLHLFDVKNEAEMETRLQRIATHTELVPSDFNSLFLKFGDGLNPGTAWKNVGLLLLIIIAALIIELGFKQLTGNFRREFLSEGIPDLNGYMRFWAGVIREIPLIIDLVIFLGAALLLFVLSPLPDTQHVTFLFMALLFAILCFRIGILLSLLVCSPNFPLLRLLPISDNAAVTFHKIMVFFFLYVGIGMSCIALVAELGTPIETLVLVIITVGSILLFITAGILIRHRQQIAEYILADETVDTGSNWIRRRFASLWHIPALLYLFIVWLVFLFQQVFSVRKDEGAFLISLMVVPLFLLFDRIGQWVVNMTVTTLKFYPVPEEDDDKEIEPDELTAEQKEKLLIARIGRIVRVAILLALGGWVVTRWGYQVPYLTTITKIVFRSLVTMALALAFWKVVTSYIERKILEEEPEQEEQEEQDDEWGGAALRGRSYTLLPMVRKFIGSVLVVMVTLIILSSIGIEIGPLLAGAGVVGLAIGFGAQKLVSDIFSGFFYLLDDAFRVGEYLEAGGVSGAVEGITLRNVMLRHHRGMLQIVPYSDLGPITNYMRGGIVVKFNLEFPYDTDIDQVRKIIKKVGQAMLDDEEFGEDFIRPVKSQGVREITNSIMVIRVKFTAKPGTHFVIRREAYRRITEALAAKGIHYAHRKVIVEVPGSENLPEEEKQKVAERGAAAGMAALEQKDKEKGSGGGGSSSGMPDM